MAFVFSHNDSLVVTQIRGIAYYFVNGKILHKANLNKSTEKPKQPKKNR